MDTCNNNYDYHTIGLITSHPMHLLFDYEMKSLVGQGQRSVFGALGVVYMCI